MYRYVGSDPINNIDPTGLYNQTMCENGGPESYIDYNFGIGTPAFVGITIGMQTAPSGDYFYIGAGVMNPGPSLSITTGPNQSPSPGLNTGAQGSLIGTGQYGEGPDGDYWEIGGGTPGFFVGGMWVFEPWN